MTRHVYPIHWPGLSIEALALSAMRHAEAHGQAAIFMHGEYALVTHDTGRGDPDDLVDVVTPGRDRRSILSKILEGAAAALPERDR